MSTKSVYFPGSPSPPGVRQWKRLFRAWILPKIIYTELTKQFIYYNYLVTSRCRSQWPCGLRRSAASRLLGCGFESNRGHGCLSVMSVVLSGRGLCEEVITRPEESYRLWCVVVCGLETSWMRRPWPTGGCQAKSQQTNKQTSCRIPARKFVWPGAGAVRRNIRYPHVDLNPNPLRQGSGG